MLSGHGRSLERLIITGNKVPVISLVSINTYNLLFERVFSI